MNIAETFNEAAVIGADVLELKLQTAEFSMQFSRKGVNTNRMAGYLCLPRHIAATCPALVSARAYGEPNDLKPCYHLPEGIPYDDFLDTLSRIHAAGLDIPHALMVEKVKAKLAGKMPKEYRVAHKVFVEIAKEALTRVQGLNLASLRDARIAELQQPTRCLALKSKSGEVFVTPDLYQWKYVQVVLSQVSPDDVLAIRDALYDAFEYQAMRVEIKTI